MISRIRQRIASLPVSRYWMEVVGLSLLALVAAILIGRTGLDRAAALEQDLRTLEAVVGQADEWIAGFQPASGREITEWRRSERAIQDIRGQLDDPLAVAYFVSRRADRIGIRDVQVELVRADTIPWASPPDPGRWSLEMARAAVSIRMGADIQSIQDFISVLPPQTEVRRFRMAGSGARPTTELLLITHRIVPR